MINERMISLHLHCKLIIFSFLLLFLACAQEKNSDSDEVSIVWKNGRATGLSISRSILKNVSKDSLRTQFQVRLAKTGEQPLIAGEFNVDQSTVIFQPFIPFTRGLSYEILIKNLAPIILEIPKASEIPQLLAIYPSQDTLPENLLKMYLVFSRPMMQGHSLQYITLTDHKGDSLPHIFLNLQHELWNEEGTVLTIWLDPGRIKRHLQPNQAFGPPLVKGKTYKLIISSEWPDNQGSSLASVYTKNIVATSRDTSSPAPDHWDLKLPTAGTLEPLQIDLGEPCDYLLLQHAIRLLSPEGNAVHGIMEIVNAEEKLNFTPAKPWSPGTYKLQIETRLEDLAGNNLGRLFDRDLTTQQKPHSNTGIYERKLNISK
jgi:hypothetical protein